MPGSGTNGNRDLTTKQTSEEKQNPTMIINPIMLEKIVK